MQFPIGGGGTGLDAETGVVILRGGLRGAETGNVAVATPNESRARGRSDSLKCNSSESNSN